MDQSYCLLGYYGVVVLYLLPKLINNITFWLSVIAGLLDTPVDTHSWFSPEKLD